MQRKRGEKIDREREKDRERKKERERQRERKIERDRERKALVFIPFATPSSLVARWPFHTPPGNIVLIVIIFQENVFQFGSTAQLYH